MKSAFMFPGQGSQSVGMMADLLAQYDVAREVFKRGSDAIDLDLQALALEGPEDRLNQTEITQPVVMVASIAMWEVWKQRSEKRPDFLFGHSLGEYTAMIASGVFSLEEGVSLVHLRGKLMQDAVPLGEGAMAAILGLTRAQIEQVCADAAQGEIVSPANFNADSQVVISGHAQALDRAISLAKEQGAKRAMLLPVSVPCHCELLKPAGEALAREMDKIDFKAPAIPIVQNLNASVPGSLEALKNNLLAHLYCPVEWSHSVRFLVDQGVEQFVECGPGKVLTGLNRRIDRSVSTINLSGPDSLADVEAALG